MSSTPKEPVALYICTYIAQRHIFIRVYKAYINIFTHIHIYHHMYTLVCASCRLLRRPANIFCSNASAHAKFCMSYTALRFGSLWWLIKCIFLDIKCQHNTLRNTIITSTSTDKFGHCAEEAHRSCSRRRARSGSSTQRFAPGWVAW